MKSLSMRSLINLRWKIIPSINHWTETIYWGTIPKAMPSIRKRKEKNNERFIEKKLIFALIISATNANPNGDPLNGNRPREDYDGYGEISDVCIKRKIRNRLQDMGRTYFCTVR